MKIFKNPEVKRDTALFAALGIVFCTAGFFINIKAGILCVLMLCVFISVYTLSAKKRYNEIERLCLSLNKILHGQNEILIKGSDEGELAILKSELEKMIIRLKEQTQHLNDDKSILTSAIADISHQIRTPLTALNLTAAQLTKEEKDPIKRRELIFKLKIQLERIDNLIEALLKLSRLDAGAVSFKHERINIKELITKACEPLLLKAELKNQELLINVENESFIGDFNMSLEALGNIIKNCTEHTPPGGRVTVAAHETPLFTEITVTDTGEGFSKNDLPHIFERFYKGENACEESVGIGLNLARKIITSQNGTITAQNGPNGGAMFTVKFYKSVI